MFEPNINIIFNSHMEVFIFELSDEGEIKYKTYDSSLRLLGSNSLYDKNILKYSVTIDENDILHLVALINTGELNYYRYNKVEWSKGTMAKFDLKSNIYNQIEIIWVKNQLHIIYNYSHLINSNIWTIQHVVYNNESKERHNAIRYVSKRIPDPFTIDVDSQGTIHLLYRTYINNSSQIYHVFYSPYTKAWSSLPKQLSSDNLANNLFPFLFIDSKDNIHGLWIEEAKDSLELKYLRMSSSGKERYIWKEISLSNTSTSNYPPIIFEDNNKLKLLYLSNDTIQVLYSTDYGNLWSDKKESSRSIEKISVVRAKANILTPICKIRHSYCNISNNINFYFLDIYPSQKLEESPDKNLVEDILEEPLEYIEPLDPIETKLEILDELDIKLQNILDNHNTLETIMKKILVNQGIMENKLDNIQKSIDSKRKSFFDRLFN